MAELVNKPEKLGFVRLYSKTMPVAEVTVQDPRGLQGLGVEQMKIVNVVEAHYCWEAGMLLISEQLGRDSKFDAGVWEVDWLPYEKHISSHACKTETVAVDKIPELRDASWEHARDLVEGAAKAGTVASVVWFDIKGKKLTPPKAGGFDSVKMSVNGEHVSSFEGTPEQFTAALQGITKTLRRARANA